MQEVDGSSPLSPTKNFFYEGNVMNDICPSAEKCPIFTGALIRKEYTTKAYKSLYCNKGVEGRNNCRRWQCKQKYGKVPEDLLPNSFQTIEQIGRQNNWL
jgi:hypothetical protein